MSDHNANAAESALQRNADDLVRREVQLCLSSMVSTLASGYGHVSARTRDYPHEGLIEQAFELSSPVLDYEEAARQAGFDVDGPILAGEPLTPVEFCERNDIEPYEWDVYEHWAVSQRLADDLIRHGERVDTDFAGLCVWARTTTGQAISMDSVIRRIAAEVFGDKATA